MNFKLASGIFLIFTLTLAEAGTIEDQIRFRQSAYAFMGWNTSKIKAQVVDHPETYNKDQVIAAANAIAAVANSGLSDLYGPGTDQGSGWKPSHLKPEYFQKQNEVAEINADLIKAAGDLQNIAVSGDVSAIKTQFGKLGAICKNCHDLVRIRD